MDPARWPLITPPLVEQRLPGGEAWRAAQRRAWMWIEISAERAVPYLVFGMKDDVCPRSSPRKPASSRRRRRPP